MMLKKVLFHYVNMGASQFLRDFRLAYKVKKNAELCKKSDAKKRKTTRKDRQCSIFGKILIS